MATKLRNLFIAALFVLMLIAFSEMKAVAPILLNPANNSTCFVYGDTLRWRAETNVASYQIQISINSDMSSPLLDTGTPSDTFYVPSPQTPDMYAGVKYYWRIRVFKKGTGIPPPQDSSQIWNFTYKYDPPFMLLPNNNTTCLARKNTFTWSFPAGYQFRLQISANSNFSPNVVDIPNISTNSQVATVPNYNTTYYWRIATMTASCTSDWSSPRTFTTAQAPPTLVAPANNSNGAQINIPLKWTATGSPISHNVQVSDDTLFNNVIIDDFVNSPYDTVYLGSFNKDYYWRVKTSYSGCETEWSNYFTFKTVYTSPTPMFPKRDSSCAPKSLRVEWIGVADAASYRYQIAEDMNFVKLVINRNKIVSLSDTVTVPNGLTTYYWRVRAEDGNNSGVWSDTFRFTTAVDYPVRTLPKDKDSGSVSVTFKWNTLGDGINYQIQISNYPDFSTKLVDKRIDGLSFDYQFSNYNKVFYWRVKAFYVLCQSAWSPTWEYKTSLLPPKLTSPANNSKKQSTNPKFQWMAPSGAEKYVFQLSKSMSFNTIVVGRNGLPNPFFSMEQDLETSTTYYWRVYCTNSEGTSTWSEIFNFTTGGLGPEVPALNYPANNAVGLDTKIKFVWKSAPRAALYHFQLSEFDDFNKTISSQEDVATTDFTVQFLDNSKTYFWRVAAINDTGKSGWSDTWTFRTIAMAPSDMATLKTPQNDAKDVPVNVSFTWDPIVRADEYEFQIADDNQFDTDAIIYADTNMSATTKYVTELPFDQEMFWRVRGKNEAGKGPWSDPWKFKSIVNSVSDKYLAEVYKIAILPNPARETAVINLILPEENQIEIGLYDITGTSLYSSKYSFMPQGDCQINLDLKPFPSGMYLVKISIGKFYQTQNIIIEK